MTANPFFGTPTLAANQLSKFYLWPAAWVALAFKNGPNTASTQQTTRFEDNRFILAGSNHTL